MTDEKNPLTKQQSTITKVNPVQNVLRYTGQSKKKKKSKVGNLYSA